MFLITVKASEEVKLVVKNYLMCRDSLVVWYSCIKDSTLCGDCVGKIVQNLLKCGKSAKIWKIRIQ